MQKTEELVDRKSSVSDECSKGSNGELLVLRHSKIHSNAFFDQDQVAADLANGNPSSLPECFCRCFPRDVCQSCHPQTATTIEGAPGFAEPEFKAF